MTNSFESRIARLFREEGYYTIISAGSKGAADVVALNEHEILFIQCKRNRNLSQVEKQRLVETAHRVNAKPLVAICKKRKLSIAEIG